MGWNHRAAAFHFESRHIFTPSIASPLPIPTNRTSTILMHVAVFLPAAVYFAVVNRYAVNMPILDDFDAILDFLCRYRQVHGVQRFFLLFEQQNEHRIFSSRVVYVLYDAMTGGVNFRNLIFLGNLELLATFVLLVALIKKAVPRHWFVASLVAGISLFDLNNWENADFATGSIQNFGILFLFTASVYCYNAKTKWQTALAVLLHATCTFSSGNGLVASVFLMLFNFFNGHRGNKYAGTAVFLLCCPLYFLHYTRVEETMVVAPAGHVIQYFFRFAGNHIYYDDNGAASVCAGAALLLGTFITLPINAKLKIREASTPLVFLLGFVLASMALISVFRANFGYYIPSRYLLYPNLLVALLFVFLLLKVPAKAGKPLSILFPLLVLLTYNMNFHGSIGKFEALQKATMSPALDYPIKSRADAVLAESCAKKIYCLER
jgi:hypothetical protein